MKKVSFLGFVSDSLSAFQKEGKQALALPPMGVGYGLTSANNDSVTLPKPTKIGFSILRQIAKVDSLTRICINTIKKEVSQSDWNIVPKAGVTADKGKLKAINELFTLLNSNDESFRVLMDRVLEDLLTLDAGVIEKVHNAKGELMELNSVDGATIFPRVNRYGELDPQKAYVQMIDGKPQASFKKGEIIYMMANPQNELGLYGFGMSPIESVLMTVQASLDAQVYNAKTFSVDNIPPGMIDLGGMGNAEATQFIALWNATVINNTQKMKFIWGSDKDKKYIPFNNGSNKDMQYVEYLDWLSRLKLAAFGLTGMDANITQDVNRATAVVQKSISNSRGVRSTKNLLEEYINREIMIPQGYGEYQFKYIEASGLTEKKLQAEIDKMYYDMGALSAEEIAEREGFHPIHQEELEDDAGSSGESPNPEDMSDVEDIDDRDENEKRTNKKVKRYYPPLYDER